MNTETGTEYQISSSIKSCFNSAEMLTIIRQSGNIVQFTLEKGKGYGSFPLQHFHYLIKKNNLMLVTNKRTLLKADLEDEQIG